MNKIYYFTRTGRSEIVAKKLSEKYSCPVFKIDDGINWKGAFGFIKGGAKASKKDLANISYEKPQENDEIVLVFPVWAGKYPPAVNTFLKENPDRSKITLIPTSLKTKFSDTSGYKKVIDLIGKDIYSQEIDLK